MANAKGQGMASAGRALVLALSVLAAPVAAQVYSAEGATGHSYWIDFEDPYQCRLYMSTPRGAILSLSRIIVLADGTSIYTRPGFPKLPGGGDRPPTPVWLQFSGDNGWSQLVSVGAEGLTLSGGDTGFRFPLEESVRQYFGKANRVRIMLGDSKRTEIDTIDLTGSSRALAALEACAGQTSEAEAEVAVANAQRVRATAGSRRAEGANARPVGENKFVDLPVRLQSGVLNAQCKNDEMSITLSSKSIFSGIFCNSDTFPTSVNVQNFSDGSTIYQFSPTFLGLIREEIIFREHNGVLSRPVHIDYISEIWCFTDTKTVITATRHLGESWEKASSSNTLTLDWASGEVASTEEGGRCPPA